MQILINDGNKLIFAEVSKIETEGSEIRFYGSCNDNLIASITYDRYKEYSAEKEARFSLLYLTELIRDQKLAAVKSDYRFEIDEDHKIVRIEYPDE